jgi:hypothetical protein
MGGVSEYATSNSSRTVETIPNHVPDGVVDSASSAPLECVRRRRVRKCCAQGRGKVP